MEVSLPARLEDLAIAAFWEAGCLGVEGRPGAPRPPARRVALAAWFPGRRDALALRRRVAAALSAAGIREASAPRLRRVADGRWVEAWQKSLRPMAIGRRFLAVPEACRAPAGTRRHVIRIPFGQAFGTGEHASTRLALRLLERVIRPGDRVVDLGTGTGILAVAAARVGAAAVVAADIDPVAVRVARDTLRRNRAGGVVRLRTADAGRVLADTRCDLALVNIGATVIEPLLPAIAGALRPGGRAILAGLLVEDEAALATAARAAGLRVAARLRSRPWSALLLRRSARP